MKFMRVLGHFAQMREVCAQMSLALQEETCIMEQRSAALWTEIQDGSRNSSIHLTIHQVNLNAKTLLSTILTLLLIRQKLAGAVMRNITKIKSI
jgi:hypothetical protein